MQDQYVALDLVTLVIVATCVTGFLGLFLLTAWSQDRSRAMLWWGTAYVIGGFSVALWLLGGGLPGLPPGLPNAFIFFACGMMWNAARIFHGRKVRWIGLCAGPVIWLTVGAFGGFDDEPALRVILSCLIIASYTFLTSAELWRERRRAPMPRWPAVFIPVLHGAVFLFPLPLAGMMPHEASVATLAQGWMALFVLETLLYVVGTAFIVMVLSKEQAVRMHKTAALTDPLTGLFNRRGFFEGAARLMAAESKGGRPVCVLAFDLDHFKAINDRFGHGLGDEALKLFAETASANMRAGDLIARLGGEEFVALIRGGIDAATAAADRVRLAFAEAGVAIEGHPVGATVSIGVAAAPAGADIHALLGWADYALYSAKANGRNRVEAALADIEAAPMPGSLAGVAADAAAPGLAASAA
jgi:diguanylate cyclase (GGDEF)-like protein